MSKKRTAILLIRIVIAILFLVSAYAKIYHEPSAYFSITTFEAKQLVPLGFESGFAAYISRILIALEFSLGFLILLPFQLKRIVVPLTISVLTAFCFHLLIQIYLTGNSGNCGCFGALLPMTPLEAIIKNINLLIDTIDKNRKTSLSRDLDYLYKHCLFAVIRVRDNKDFDFLDGCVKVLSDITEGWERVDLSIKKAPAFG